VIATSKKIKSQMNNARSREPPITRRGASTGEASSDPATPLGGRGQRAATDKPADPPPSTHHSGASYRQGGRIHTRGGRIRAGRGLLRPELARNGRCRRINANPPTTPTPNPLEEGMGVAAARTPSARLRRHQRSTGMGGAARARHWWSSPPWFA
jgi:hypothetical protein